MIIPPMIHTVRERGGGGGLEREIHRNTLLTYVSVAASLNEILAASLGTLEERQQTVNNPESYAFFSLAYWSYKNPPEGALPVTFYQGSAVYA